MSFVNGVLLCWERFWEIYDFIEWEMGIVFFGLFLEFDFKYEVFYGYF